MAKSPIRPVLETVDELLRFQQVYRGRPQEARVRLLHVLRTQPELTFEQAADAAGVVHRSAYRWWKIYQERGVAGLLNFEMGRPAGRQKRPKPATNGHSEAAGTDAADLVALMNGMPIDLGLLEGINGVRDRLMTLLGDVDRISISVNTHCDLEHPEDYRPNLGISQRGDRAERLDDGMDVRTIRDAESPASDILEQMRKGGFPFDQYHEPVAIDLWYAETADLGAIVLWREIEKTPVSEATIARIETLRPFLVYVFSNLVTRHHYANPRDRVFYSALRDMADSAGLTPQERRIISYRLMGYSYKKIAAELDRTEGAVKKQLASVHRKTGTQGHSELFAKYFTPRLLREE